MNKPKMRKMNKGGESDGIDTEDTTDYTGGQDDLPSAKATAPKAAPKMVTKEELAKSGLSLRDYLNKQQGLTRRGEASAPSRAGMQDALNAANKPFADTKRPGIVARMREADKSVKGVREAAPEAKAPARSPAKAISKEMSNPREINARMSRGFEPRQNYAPSRGYANGGSVSASRRADGIAAKGKTRGRMC
jgi:hypothetical protein